MGVPLFPKNVTRNTGGDFLYLTMWNQYFFTNTLNFLDVIGVYRETIRFQDTKMRKSGEKLHTPYKEILL